LIKAQDVDFYNENGYLLVRGVFNQQEVEDMRRATDSIIQKAAQSKHDWNPAWGNDFMSPEELKKLVLKGFHDVHYHDAAFTRAVTHPNMQAIVSQLIGPNVQLHHSKMLVKPPENGAAFPMHQDYPYFPHANHTMMAASVHMDDADMENGCLCVVPGSHKLGPIHHVGKHYLSHKEYPISDGTPCPAKAGDVLFFNYLTIHTRRNVLFQYRDPMDPPTENVHVNWGQGLMITGENLVFQDYHAAYKKVEE